MRKLVLCPLNSDQLLTQIGEAMGAVQFNRTASWDDMIFVDK